MKDLLYYILKNITKSDLEIEETVDGTHITFTIKAKSENIGLIIGKEGSTIRAIRSLLKVMAVLEQKSVSLTVAES